MYFMTQDLCLGVTSDVVYFFSQHGEGGVKLDSSRQTEAQHYTGQMGPNMCNIGYFWHILDVSGATRIVCVTCDMPCSRGQRARHVELLVAVFCMSSDILYILMGQKGATCSRENQLYNITSHLWGRGATTHL